MSKLHSLKAVGTKEKRGQIGVFGEFKLTETSFASVSHHIMSGVETISPIERDRVLIVFDGLANNTDTKEVIRENSVIEIKAGTTLEFQGQLKYYLVTK